jgi:hypothetical protein
VWGGVCIWLADTPNMRGKYMFREKFKQEIEETLAKSTFFSVFDFNIIQDKEKSSIITIYYKYDSEYFLEFEIPTSTTEVEQQYSRKSYYYYKAKISPWDAAKVEKVAFESKDKFLSGILTWLKYLEEDLLSIPLNRKINDYEQKLAEYTEMVNDLDGEYFSRSDAENLKSKISELQEQMIANINNLYKKSDEKEEYINNLKKEIEALKSKFEILDKKSVFKSLFGKFLQWSSRPENQKLIDDGSKFFKSLIENKPDAS